MRIEYQQVYVECYDNMREMMKKILKILISEENAVMEEVIEHLRDEQNMRLERPGAVFTGLAVTPTKHSMDELTTRGISETASIQDSCKDIVRETDGLTATVVVQSRYVTLLVWNGEQR
ncbi:hypothetical protein CAEBREN_14561 [Caenorhabditis brenneri]|uniref:Uncharacterized protein n=1 Tax=Caenorhabditis brenneri TaxID=135651 RepID=G0NKW0_CAEBE|nr:hypothetical protein CAEBREN_14561 [Caenorhabditis brenneri]